MKAITYEVYGPPEVLKIKETEMPVPNDNEVLVKIHATTVNFGEIMARNFNKTNPWSFTMPGLLWLPSILSFGIRRPRNQILGSEFSGEIEAVGKDVTRFKTGDEVFGYRGQNMGSYAEYVSVPENSTIAVKPNNMTHGESAGIAYGSIMAISHLRRLQIQSGQKVLIIGASGGIGQLAVQVAKYYGAIVTGISSTSKVDLVKKLGADHVIDYKNEDYTKSSEKYDIIYDVMRHSSFSKARKVLKTGGRYVLVSFKARHLWMMLFTKILGGKKLICSLAMEKAEDMDFTRELAEEGHIISVVDKTFTMDQASEAHQYVEDRQRNGNVIISVIED